MKANDAHTQEGYSIMFHGEEDKPEGEGPASKNADLDLGEDKEDSHCGHLLWVHCIQVLISTRNEQDSFNTVLGGLRDSTEPEPGMAAHSLSTVGVTRTTVTA